MNSTNFRKEMVKHLPVGLNAACQGYTHKNDHYFKIKCHHFVVPLKYFLKY